MARVTTLNLTLTQLTAHSVKIAAIYPKSY